jgi:hypothetical protein
MAGFQPCAPAALYIQEDSWYLFILEVEPDRTCHVVIVKNPSGSNFGFLDQSRYFLFQVSPQ